MRISSRTIIVLVLAAGVVTGAVLYLRRASRAAHTAELPPLISLVPASTSYVFYADLAALRSSRFLARLVALAPEPAAERDYAEFVRATGFDYARDLDRVVLAVRPEPPGDFTVAVAEGRFDREKLARYVLRSGKIERQNGLEVYVVPAATQRKAIAFAWLGANRLALADGPSLASLLALQNSQALTPDMRERIARLGSAPLFALGRVGPLAQDLSFAGVRSEQFANLLRSLHWISLAARPEGEHMRVVAEAECDTAEDARQLAGTLDGLRLLGQAALADPRNRQRLPPGNAAALDAVARAAAVSRQNHQVRLMLELTPQMLPAAPTPSRSSPSTR